MKGKSHWLALLIPIMEQGQNRDDLPNDPGKNYIREWLTLFSKINEIHFTIWSISWEILIFSENFKAQFEYSEVLQQFVIRSILEWQYWGKAATQLLGKCRQNWLLTYPF